jgi:hypothetical protein
MFPPTYIQAQLARARTDDMMRAAERRRLSNASRSRRRTLPSLTQRFRPSNSASTGGAPTPALGDTPR